MLAGSSEAIDNSLNTVLAKVSPSLLRRRTPSPVHNTSSCTPAPQTVIRKSEQYLSPDAQEQTDGMGASKSSSDGSSQHSSSPSDTTQIGQGGTLSKSPSSGSVGKGKNKVPNQAKKKSWYSVFYPSYKSRSADFKKLFKDVPDEERLLVGEYLHD